MLRIVDLQFVNMNVFLTKIIGKRCFSFENNLLLVAIKNVVFVLNSYLLLTVKFFVFSACIT